MSEAVSRWKRTFGKVLDVPMPDTLPSANQPLERLFLKHDFIYDPMRFEAGVHLFLERNPHVVANLLKRWRMEGGETDSNVIAMAIVPVANMIRHNPFSFDGDLGAFTIGMFGGELWALKTQLGCTGRAIRRIRAAYGTPGYYPHTSHNELLGDLLTWVRGYYPEGEGTIVPQQKMGDEHPRVEECTDEYPYNPNKLSDPIEASWAYLALDVTGALQTPTYTGAVRRIFREPCLIKIAELYE